MRRSSRIPVPVRSFWNNIMHRHKSHAERGEPKRQASTHNTPAPQYRSSSKVLRSSTIIRTPRRNAPLPNAPTTMSTPHQRHNNLIAQSGSIRLRVNGLADRVRSPAAKLYLLQSLEYFNGTVMNSAKALAAYEQAQTGAVTARTCWESCHWAVNKHMELLSVQIDKINRLVAHHRSF